MIRRFLSLLLGLVLSGLSAYQAVTEYLARQSAGVVSIVAGR
jgi:hypothetical protein